MPDTSNTKNRTTPGVYVTEFPAFPPSIVGVATAVPVFIGYTEYAGDPTSGTALYGQAVPISSMADYASYFGGAAPGGGFALAAQMQIFFDNGGGNCFVVSAGSYWTDQSPAAAPAAVSADWVLGQIEASALAAGLTVAGNASGPTMTVIPEACQLPEPDYIALVQAMVDQAGTLQDRVAILDLPGCLTADTYVKLDAARTVLWTALAGRRHLSYGVAYAPALKLADGSVLAPSGALAGIWTQCDATRGVWNAPANVPLTGVAAPLYQMNDDQQGDFNVPLNGMAVDMLRSFVGRGTLVWGARTLDGNSLDYRYIQVRRTLIYIERSIQTALSPFAFAANDAATWTTVASMISNFLTQLWSQGGLMGDKASDAFTVQCGLGSTMTGKDILDGLMRVSVTLQMIHPAEFIELSFVQQMQGS